MQTAASALRMVLRRAGSEEEVGEFDPKPFEVGKPPGSRFDFALLPDKNIPAATPDSHAQIPVYETARRSQEAKTSIRSRRKNRRTLATPDAECVLIRRDGDRLKSRSNQSFKQFQLPGRQFEHSCRRWRARPRQNRSRRRQSARAMRGCPEALQSTRRGKRGSFEIVSET